MLWIALVALRKTCTTRAIRRSIYQPISSLDEVLIVGQIVSGEGHVANRKRPPDYAVVVPKRHKGRIVQQDLLCGVSQRIRFLHAGRGLGRRKRRIEVADIVRSRFDSSISIAV